MGRLSQAFFTPSSRHLHRLNQPEAELPHLAQAVFDSPPLDVLMFHPRFFTFSPPLTEA